MVKFPGKVTYRVRLQTHATPNLCYYPVFYESCLETVYGWLEYLLVLIEIAGDLDPVLWFFQAMWVGE